MSVVLAIAPQSAIPRRLDGVVTENKGGIISIEYKEKGAVKPKIKQYRADELIAYCVGAPGFVVDRSTDPITQIVGSNSSSGLKTELGAVVITPNAQNYALLSRSEVEDDSREARTAARVGSVKVKLPKDKTATRTSAKVKDKSSKEDKSAKSSKSSGKERRAEKTEASSKKAKVSSKEERRSKK